MNLQQAKDIPITWFYSDVLGLRGKRSANDILYSSPFRDDGQPSYSVSINKNISYDFATGEARDLVGSVQSYYKLQSVSDALRKLSALTVDSKPRNSEYYLQSIESDKNHNYKNNGKDEGKRVRISKDDNIYNEARIVEAKDLYYYPLKNYIKDIRKVNVDTAGIYLKEVHYKLANNSKTYFGLGMENMSGGYEISMYNTKEKKTFKTAIGSKDITFIKGKDDGSKIILIFEGRFDFLSLLEKEGMQKFNEDVIILNSISCYKRATDFIQTSNKYSEAHLYLDNDDEGKKTFAKIQKSLIPKEQSRAVSNKVDSGMSSIGDILKFTYGVRVVDKSDLYSGYKDLNDWWVRKF